jgi:hypothetical protein
MAGTHDFDAQLLVKYSIGIDSGELLMNPNCRFRMATVDFGASALFPWRR